MQDAGWCYGGWQVAKEVLSEGSLLAHSVAESSEMGIILLAITVHDWTCAILDSELELVGA